MTASLSIDREHPFTAQALTKHQRDANARAVVIKLLDACADLYKTTPRKLSKRHVGRSRAWQFEAHCVMAVILVEDHDWSYAGLGRALGMHHTSVIHAVDRGLESEAVDVKAAQLSQAMAERHGEGWWAI